MPSSSAAATCPSKNAIRVASAAKNGESVRWRSGGRRMATLTARIGRVSIPAAYGSSSTCFSVRTARVRATYCAVLDRFAIDATVPSPRRSGQRGTRGGTNRGDKCECHEQRQWSVRTDAARLEYEPSDCGPGGGAHGRGRRLPPDGSRSSLGADPLGGDDHQQREDDR